MVALVLFFILLLRLTVFEPFRIPSGSMMPSLMIGDFILVSKLFYRPTVGDVVVFRYPKDPAINYIKRIVAGPGDTLEIKGRHLFVNGQRQEKREKRPVGYEEEIVEYYGDYDLRFSQVKTGDQEHGILEDRDDYFVMDDEEITLGESEYFVMGDNRDFSYDSRFWGSLEETYIRGRALFVWLSVTLPWEEGPFIFRPGRIGEWID